MPDQPVDTLAYLTDEQLMGRYKEETDRVREQMLTMDRTRERRRRLWDALQARGFVTP